MVHFHQIDVFGKPNLHYTSTDHTSALVTTTMHDTFSWQDNPYTSRSGYTLPHNVDGNAYLRCTAPNKQHVITIATSLQAAAVSIAHNRVTCS